MDLTFADVLAAEEIVRRHLPPTPMWAYPALSGDARVFVKHENVQPVDCVTEIFWSPTVNVPVRAAPVFAVTWNST